MSHGWVSWEDEMNALKKELSRYEWKPIETAPRDSWIWVIADCGDGRRGIAAKWHDARTGYDHECGPQSYAAGFYHEEGLRFEPKRVNATHWMELALSPHGKPK